MTFRDIFSNFKIGLFDSQNLLGRNRESNRLVGKQKQKKSDLTRYVKCDVR